MKTQVFNNDFPQFDPVLRQAVALGGNPLKRKTGMAGVEGDLRFGFWGRTAVLVIETVEGDGEMMPSFRAIELERAQ